MNVALRIGVLLAVVLAASTSAQQSSMLPSGPALRNDKKMFGLIGRMTAVEGKRDELMTILVNALSAVPA